MAQNSWTPAPTTFEAGDTPPYEGLPPPHFVDRNQFYDSTADWEIDLINAETQFREALLKQREGFHQKTVLDGEKPYSTTNDVDPIEYYRSIRSRWSRKLPSRPWPRPTATVSAPPLEIQPPRQSALMKEDEARRDSTQEPLTPQSPDDTARLPDPRQTRGRTLDRPLIPGQRTGRSPTTWQRRSFSASSGSSKSHSSSDSEETETESTYRRKLQRKRRLNLRLSPPRTIPANDGAGPDGDTIMSGGLQQWTADQPPNSVDVPLVQRRNPPSLLIQPAALTRQSGVQSHAREPSSHGAAFDLVSPASAGASSSPVSPLSVPITDRRRSGTSMDDDFRLDPEEIDLLHPNTVYLLGCDPTWIAHLPGPILVRRRGLLRRRWERDPNDTWTFPPLNQLTFKPKEKALPVQQAAGNSFQQLDAVTRRWTDEECAEIIVGWRLHNQPLHDGQTVAMPHLNRDERLKVCYRTATRFQEYLRVTRQRPWEVEYRPQPWLVMRDWNSEHRSTVRNARSDRERAPSPETTGECSQAFSDPTVHARAPQNGAGSSGLPDAIPPRNPARLERNPPATPRPRNASLPSPPPWRTNHAELKETNKKLSKEDEYLKLENMLVQDYEDSFSRAPRLARTLEENGHWPSSIRKIVDSAEFDPLEPCSDPEQMEAAEWETVVRATRERDKNESNRYKPDCKRPPRRMTRTYGSLHATNLDQDLADIDDEFENESDDASESEDDTELQEAMRLSLSECKGAQVVDLKSRGTHDRTTSSRKSLRATVTAGRRLSTSVREAARPTTPPQGASTIRSPFLERTIYNYCTSEQWPEIKAKIDELRLQGYSEGQIEQAITQVLSGDCADAEDESPAVENAPSTMPPRRGLPFEGGPLENMINRFVFEYQPAVRATVEEMREAGCTNQDIERELQIVLDKMKRDHFGIEPGVLATTGEEQLRDEETDFEKDKENERPANDSAEANMMAGYESEEEGEDEDGMHSLYRC